MVSITIYIVIQQNIISLNKNVGGDVGRWWVFRTPTSNLLSTLLIQAKGNKVRNCGHDLWRFSLSIQKDCHKLQCEHTVVVTFSDLLVKDEREESDPVKLQELASIRDLWRNA